MSKTSCEAKNKYNKKSYDTFLLTMAKGHLSQLKSIAAEHGIPVNTLVREAITEYIKNNYNIDNIDFNEFPKGKNKTE